MRRRSASTDSKSNRVVADGPSSASGPSSSRGEDGNLEVRSNELSVQPTTSNSPLWNEEEDEDSGPRPSDLYGKFTWKIETFSAISKRELRSNIFEVGGYKWYILVYPHGCDVCNHLSLFLCVADYDKLLPGWNHFAQFTIAVVNKDPKKSKYSDTLHRFCKKEHDWGWKKFMEVGKVLDGFTVADTLVIKAQVQVIRDIIHKPVRCLDWQYRRELVRVYLTNVETICRRFVDEKREKLVKLMEETKRWASLRIFWSALDENLRHRLAAEFRDVINKALVKRFFNDKEVTSTLVMDALYSGCKELESLAAGACAGRKGGIRNVEDKNPAGFTPVVWIEKDMIFLAGDVIELLERAASETMPLYKDDKTPQSRSKEGMSDDAGKEAIERDDKRLTELGRRTVEMFVLTHIFCNRVEVAFREAVALRRQEELIREEEAAEQAENELRAKKELSDKEKKNKKKLAKQRKKEKKEQETRKALEETNTALENGTKEKKNDTKEEEVSIDVEDVIVANTERTEVSNSVYESDTEPSSTNNQPEAVTKSNIKLNAKPTAKTNAKSNSKNGSKNKKSAPPADSKSNSKLKSEPDPNSIAKTIKAQTVNETSNPQVGTADVDADIDGTRKGITDDTWSTCSSDSLLSTHPPSSAASGDTNFNGTVGLNGEARMSDRSISDQADRAHIASMNAEPSSQNSGLDADTIILSLKERVRWLEQRLQEKEEEVVLLQQQLSLFQSSSSHASSNNHGKIKLSADSEHGTASQTSSSPNQLLPSVNGHVNTFKSSTGTARNIKSNDGHGSKPPRISSVSNRSSSSSTSSTPNTAEASHANPPYSSPARKPSVPSPSLAAPVAVSPAPIPHGVGNGYAAGESVNQENGSTVLKNAGGSSYKGMLEGGNSAPSYRNAIVGKVRTSPSPAPSAVSANSTGPSFIASPSAFPPISSTTLPPTPQSNVSSTTSSSLPQSTSSSLLSSQTIFTPAIDSVGSQTLSSIPSLSQHSASSLHSPSPSSPVSSISPSHFTGDDETGSFRSNSPGLPSADISFVSEKDASMKEDDKVSPWVSSMEGSGNSGLSSIPPLTFGNLPSIDLTPPVPVPVAVAAPVSSPSPSVLPIMNPLASSWHPLETGVLPEDFPHLSLINDLLDEDRDMKASSLFMHASISAVGKEMHDGYGKDGRGFVHEDVSSQSGFLKGERRIGSSAMWTASVNHTMANGRVDNSQLNGFVDRRGNDGDLAQQMRMHIPSQSPFGSLPNGYGSLYDGNHVSR